MAELLKAGFTEDAAERILKSAQPGDALELRAHGYEPDYVLTILCGSCN